jgi:hypothetical protein
MANVHGIEFNSSQAELVKGLIRELLKDGNCAVYALPHMKPNGELRMGCTPPAPNPRHQHGVFLRIRPGVKDGGRNPSDECQDGRGANDDHEILSGGVV